MEFSYRLALERKKTIEYWARYTVSDEQKSIRKFGIGHSHALISSLGYKTLEDADEIKAVELTLNYYGKFVDMGVGRGWKLEDISGNRMMYGAIGLKGRRAKKWLGKVVYTNIASLRHILMERYKEDSVNIVKEGLSNNLL